MARQVTIKRIALVNFKGARNQVVHFDGSRTEISGRNGSGKTTIFDAFNWLCWGKDSTGRSDQNFSIKTTDAAGDFIPHLEHEVTADFEITDTETGEVQPLTLRRIYKEDWKTRSGETEEYLDGHHTDYYVNGVPLKTKKLYDEAVAEVIPEALFKTLTNPSHFLTLPWQQQRDMLMDMAGEISEETLPGYQRLAEVLKGRSLDGYKDMIKDSRQKVEADLKSIPTRIDEVVRNTPAALDFAALEKQLGELQARYDETDAAITSQAEANRVLYAQQAKITQDISTLRIKQQQLVNDAKTKAIDEAYKANAEHDKIARNLQELETEGRHAERQYSTEKQRLEAEIDQHAKAAERLAKQQEALRNYWYETNAKEFKDTEQLICPLFKSVCGDTAALQAYEQDRRAAKAAFDEDKAATLKQITDEGKKVGNTIKNENEARERAAQELSELTEKHEATAQERRTEIERLQGLKDSLPVVSTNPTIDPKEVAGWKEAEDQITVLQLEQTALQSVAAGDRTEDLRRARRELQQQMDTVKADLAKREQVEAKDKRIAELNEQKTKLMQHKAELQKQEDEIVAFEKAKMDEVERRVNGLFNLVTFKMYRTQIEDAKQVPDCVCYIDGVKYRDKNQAGKINAGLDVINALCRYYETTAPVFIDCAESVNDFIPTDSQLIALSVTKGDFTVQNL